MVRPAEERDIEPIARVLAASWAWAFAEFVPPELLAPRIDPAQRAEAIRRTWGLENRRRLVDVDDGVVVGFASEIFPPNLPQFDAEIEGLYVHPDAARKGVGRRLVRAVVIDAIARGCRSMAIHTLAENRIGRSFYERIGGRVVLEDEWHSLPTVWYAWDQASLAEFLQ